MHIISPSLIHTHSYTLLFSISYLHSLCLSVSLSLCLSLSYTHFSQTHYLSHARTHTLSLSRIHSTHTLSLSVKLKMMVITTKLMAVSFLLFVQNFYFFAFSNLCKKMTNHGSRSVLFSIRYEEKEIITK